MGLCNSACKRQDERQGVLGHSAGIATGRVYYENSVFGRGIEIDLGCRRAADAYESQVRALLKGLFENKVGLYYQYRDVFREDTVSEVVRVRQCASVQPTLIRDIHP